MIFPISSRLEPSLYLKGNERRPKIPFIWLQGSSGSLKPSIPFKTLFLHRTACLRCFASSCTARVICGKKSRTSSESCRDYTMQPVSKHAFTISTLLIPLSTGSLVCDRSFISLLENCGQYASRKV